MSSEQLLLIMSSPTTSATSTTVTTSASTPTTGTTAATAATATVSTSTTATTTMAPTPPSFLRLPCHPLPRCCLPSELLNFHVHSPTAVCHRCGDRGHYPFECPNQRPIPIDWTYFRDNGVEGRYYRNGIESIPGGNRAADDWVDYDSDDSFGDTDTDESEGNPVIYRQV